MEVYVVIDADGRLAAHTTRNTPEAVEDYMINHYHLWIRMKAAGARIVKAEIRVVE